MILILNKYKKEIISYHLIEDLKLILAKSGFHYLQLQARFIRSKKSGKEIQSMRDLLVE